MTILIQLLELLNFFEIVRNQYIAASILNLNLKIKFKVFLIYSLNPFVLIN